MIEKLTVNPRKVMNISTDLFAIGEKAQITVFNPNEKWTSQEMIFILNLQIHLLLAMNWLVKSNMCSQRIHFLVYKFTNHCY
ncbi:MAG: hypothetical protein CM1200mP1_03630 [Candidatus Neomarinimicrobiota bacterium]|nr:MAG: hypothetical protein CM1200mP1_03630 [Candidatus Neomarinimicrobiota bacterium]